MYEELIAKLRDHAEWYNAEIWVMPITIIDDLIKAADAIEELSNAGSIYGKAWTLGYDAGRDENKPHWLPVTKNSPKEGDSVLGVFKFQGGNVCIVTERIMRNGKEIWSAAVGMKPFAWMPLPEPTEEEH